MSVLILIASSFPSLRTYPVRTKNFAIYKSDSRGEETSKNAIYVVGLALNVMAVAVVVVFAVFWLHILWLRRGLVLKAIQRVNKQCPCMLRCARRCCPKRCCGGGALDGQRQRQVRVGSSISSSSIFSSSLPSPQNEVDVIVEMTTMASNPLHPRSQGYSGKGTSAKSSASQETHEERNHGALGGGGGQQTPRIEGRKKGKGQGRRDMFETGGVESRNPIFSESPEMIELTNRRSRGKAMKVKSGRMVPHFSSESRDQEDEIDAAHAAREESAASRFPGNIGRGGTHEGGNVGTTRAAVLEGKTTEGALDL